MYRRHNRCLSERERLGVIEKQPLGIRSSSSMGDPPPPAPVRRTPWRSAKRTTNYYESLMDECFDGGSSRRRLNRTAEERQRETETEAMIAISLGFPIDDLLEAEIAAGVIDPSDGAAAQNDYIVVRNHILARWRANVNSYLSKSEIKETISSKYDQLISSAYHFLTERGYINFGVSPAIRAEFPEEHNKAAVIIIGAGLAGLAAARQLLSFGFKVLILEGRNRPGGRVYTTKLGENGKFSAVDLGGSVITGIHANPLGVLARQLGIPLHKIRDKCPLFRPDGRDVDEKLDLEVDSVFNKLLAKAAEARQILGEFANEISLGTAIERLRKLYGVARSNEERELLDWHLANLEYANAGCLSDLSLAHWDQDDPYEMDGDHCFLAGGNGRLINALCEDVPILYGKTVTRIEHGDGGGVKAVVVGGQVFEADMLLCTVPLGILKKGSIKFDPELPSRKLDAIQRLGFGLLNKVTMVFPCVFWGEEIDTFGSINSVQHKRGEFFLFYGYHTVSGGALLIALVAGQAALTFESTDPVVSLHKVLGILRGIYGPRGVHVPDPIKTICTRWGSDSLSHGSYSHVRVGSSGKDYDILAENVGEQLFFAGEATIREHPATMHGAFLSGLREASCILHAWRKIIVSKNDPKKCLQKNLKLYKDVLQDMFREPDLAFGNFFFIFDPSTPEDLKAAGLMRVSFGISKIQACQKCTSKMHANKDKQSPDHPHCAALHLYSSLSREQAYQLQQVSGDDKIKLEFLCKRFSLKLVGCNSICSLSSSLITQISTARKSRNRQHRTMHSKMLS